MKWLLLVREPPPAFHQRKPRYVAFVDDFPRTPTQRILKRELPRDTAGSWDLEASGLDFGRGRA